MDVKRYFRAPIMWIVLAVVAVLVLMQAISSSSGYKVANTGEGSGGRFDFVLDIR